MDIAHSLLVNAAGILYASVGFSLSVVAALLNLICHSRSNIPIELVFPDPVAAEIRHSPVRRLSVRRPPIRSFSDSSAQMSPREIRFFPGQGQSVSPLEKKVNFQRTPSPSRNNVPQIYKNEESPMEKRRFPHRRSRSIPAIMVDNFDSAEYITWTSPDRLKAEPLPLETISHIPEPLQQNPHLSPPSTSQTTSTLSSTPNTSNPISVCIPNGKPRTRLFHPKSWGKEKKPRTLKRCLSSPQMYKGPLLPLPPPSPTNKLASSDSEHLPESSLKKIKSWKSLRKSRSGTVPEKATPKPEPRKAEKKKSQTLRTHPYEAPYFAPPPIPALPVHITLISDHTTSEISSSSDSSPKSSLEKKSIRKRLSRS